jgi:hypothetical protein
MLTRHFDSSLHGSYFCIVGNSYPIRLWKDGSLYAKYRVVRVRTKPKLITIAT